MEYRLALGDTEARDLAMLRDEGCWEDAVGLGMVESSMSGTLDVFSALPGEGQWNQLSLGSRRQDGGAS